MIGGGRNFKTKNKTKGKSVDETLNEKNTSDSMSSSKKNTIETKKLGIGQRQERDGCGRVKLAGGWSKST